MLKPISQDKSKPLSCPTVRPLGGDKVNPEGQIPCEPLALFTRALSPHR